VFNHFETWFSEQLVRVLSSVIFFDLWFWDAPGSAGREVPLVVVWLALGALFCTARFRFANLRLFRHGIDCVRGRYSQAGDRGEISHFQALSAALSATVGLGNIAGVGVAVGLGGPGAVFWMVLAGFFGMSAKFAECTLGQRYRQYRSDGHVVGGPMIYLRRGLQELGMGRLGKALAGIFAVFCIGASLGGGNMFQANQAYQQVASVVPALSGPPGAAVFGVVLVVAVALVIVGGIRRIGEVAGVLVPVMCAVYVGAGLLILLFHWRDVPDAFATIVREAFSPRAGIAGGFVGVLIQGLRRSAFSNEAGVGSAPIAHATATTEEPVREGIVALLEPFIDTIVVCTMTGLVIVTTGAYLESDLQGIAITSAAFSTVFPKFPILLSVIAVLFAYSTMISWSYYGERCFEMLFGDGRTLVFKALFLLFTLLGSMFQLSSVIDFSDMMLLGMSFPNLLGVALLSGILVRELRRYEQKLAAGEFPRSV
jgi:AGCS family alanine or glycine:cation symporter